MTTTFYQALPLGSLRKPNWGGGPWGGLDF